MTATEILRRLLDERGVEWIQGRVSSDSTAWLDGGAAVVADEYGDGLLLVERKMTPEQAVEATLGRGTCRDVRSADHTIAFECSECGCWVAYDEYWETGIYVLHETGQEHIHPRYCPNCGRRVEQ